MPHALVGTWKLLSCEHTFDDGSRWLPFGERPSGRLVYAPSGHMMVMLMRRGRKPAGSGQIFDAKASERAAAADGFLAYSGRCELDRGRVVHHVDLSLFPNWVGTAQMRTYRLKGDRVTFETRRFLARGRYQTAALTWKREKSA